MKRILCILAVLLLLMSPLAFSAAAEASLSHPLVADGADLLTTGEEEALTATLRDILATHGIEVAVVTATDTKGYTPRGYAERLFDTSSYGCGENRDGVLLLIAMEERDWYILTNGRGYEAISDSTVEDIGNAMLDDLSEGRYAAAFDTFAEECAYYIDGYLNGFPFAVGKNLLIALVIGAVIGIVTALVLKGQLRSVRRQHRADMYVKDGSMRITHASDLFLYRTVTRVKIERPSSGGGRSGGGSRGGGGGKF